MCAAPVETIRNLEDFAGIASDWFWETDAHHRFTYFSTSTSLITKMSAGAVLGQRRQDIPGIDPTQPGWDVHFEDLAARRPFRNFEYAIQRPQDGSVLWVRASGNPVFDDVGNFTGYRGVGHDITSEKQAMARLEATNATLAERNRQLDEAHCALERSASKDTLTGVLNRRAFERDIAARLDCPAPQLALMHIDLDRFKWVNDTFGHPGGDVVLQTTAARIRLAVKGLGNVYRVGGDEFMVLLRDSITRHEALRLGHRITDAITTSIPFGTRGLTVGASIGIAFADNVNETPQSLISHADFALYEAKQRGRSAVCILDGTLQDRIEHNRRLAADIPLALKRGEFVPYFQPQVNIATGKVIGVEALVRWVHPTRGVLTPDVFLKAATAQGLVEDIDREMLRLGLEAMRRLKAEGMWTPSLSINMSEARLLDPRLISDVGCHWTDRSIGLTFELLETIHFDDLAHHDVVHDNLRRLRAMGVSIDTDDFGSGRASITGLLQVAPDRLKIDRSLVKEVVTSSRKRSIIRAIIEMANALGIECLAEGVETPEAIEVISRLGCQSAQGFAISKPLGETDLRAFLAARPSSDSQPAPETKAAGLIGLPRFA